MNEERREGQIEMAQAVIGSLVSLKELVKNDPGIRLMWMTDPVRCLTLMIETLEARHMRGLDNDGVRKRVSERMKR